MPMNCLLTRSVVSEGWLSPARTPVVVLAVTNHGKIRCRSMASVGPNGEVRDDKVIEVLPEELRFAAVYPGP